MAKKRKKQAKKKIDKEPLFDDLSTQAKQAMGAIGFVVLGIFFTLSLFDFAGMVGTWARAALSFLFGGGAYLAPFVCGFYVYVLLNPKDDDRVSTSKIFGIALLFVTALAFLALYKEGAGGIAGWLLEAPLAYLMGAAATGVTLAGILVGATLMTFNTGLHLPSFLRKKEAEPLTDDIAQLKIPEDTEPEEETPEEAPEEEDTTKKPAKKTKKVAEKLGLTKDGEFLVSNFEGTYAPPPLSLLSKDSKGKAKVGDVKANANIIKRKLQTFKIDVEVEEVTIGPTVTRYALKPAEGVRVAKIAGLQSDLELALSASPIRIEAPIPGKALVGIEVPNITKATVGLASLLKSPEYTDSPKPLMVALGRDITGKAHFADVAKMPHTLIAGTTGSGKSVTIHTMVTSLLFRNSPDQLRFIMVDPKRVELTLYNEIPHLLTPVITDAKKAILSLKWAIKEMERRYDILQSEKVRDIGSYHENIYRPAKAAFAAATYEDPAEEEAAKAILPEPLPFIVIVMDELADLMQAYPRELEAAIVRLAQMSRAVGIHLLLATQRPSVNVITGTIKANIPTRLALQVASQIDSRTILDQVGAEKLLGQGDTLFLSGELSKPIRIQSAYIDENELKDVVNYLKNQSSAQELDSIDLDGKGEDNPDAFFESVVDDEDSDDLYDDAKRAVVDAGKASTSYLQRKLRVGYSRAARLMDMLEERGVIGQQDGSKPREILLGEGMGADDEESEPTY
jgi:S-DNA-T family DNA segregation ATPase FtsK/SpoIIIE